jgi:hypothetical protein
VSMTRTLESACPPAPTRAPALLHALAWRAEKLFRQRGHFRTYLWLTEDEAGHQTWFETACEAAGELADSELLASLRSEVRADFHSDGVVRYGVAFTAQARTVVRQSILHLEAKRVQLSVVALEAHDGDLHLRAHRGIAGSRLTALTSIEAAPGCWGALC